ncbi:MAG TPA: hypothetical protein VFL98_02205 [Candidatus Paceibacterota bacterium]|nr:hypothetical protein [Candidatus Paceibacterota bacterium]
MKLTPFSSAGIAAAYICGIVLLIGLTSGLELDNGLLGAIIVLSLLVCSVSVMGMLFFYQPVRMLLGGKADEALRFFLTTLAWFIGIMLAIVIIVFIADKR